MKKYLIPIIIIAISISCNSNENIIFQNSNYEVDKKRSSATKTDIMQSKKIFIEGKDLYRKKNDLLNSVKKFHEAIKLYPDQDYYYELGNCYIDLKDYDNALKSFKIALDFKYGELAPIYYNASCAASLNKQKDLSLFYLEKALLNNYPNISHLKQDKDLDFIKNDEGFKKILNRFDVSITEVERKYIGIWQPTPIMASGWMDNYTFLPDRTYIFKYNQMDCSKRIISENGYWEIKNNKLILKKMNQKRIEGGKLIPTMGGSCGSKETLIDGKEIITKIEPIEIKEYNISLVYEKTIIPRNNYNEGLKKLIFKLNNLEYFFYGDNPDYFK